MKLMLLLCALIPAAVSASPEWIVIGTDAKVQITERGLEKAAPGQDLTVFIDVAEDELKLNMHFLAMPNSLFGPPSNLAVTPDQKLAIIANSVKWVGEEGAWESAPETHLHLVDLESGKPKKLGTVETKAQPSGISISRDGKRLLVANRADRSVSLFSIDGESLKMLDTLVIDGEAAAVTFAPDGKAALVTKFAEHHVALLRIVEDKLVYDAKQDIPVGLWPYNVKITPDGKVAIVCNTGNNGLPDGHCDTLSVIGLSTKEPHVASTVSVGDGPEGLAISPDGKYVAVPLLNGSADMFKDEWFYHPHGEVVLYELKGTGLTERSRVKTGAFPEGISFSADGSRLFVANLADGNLSTFSVNKGRLASEGEPLRIPVPGKPGSMGSAQP